MSPRLDELEVVRPGSREDWRAWLAEHGETTSAAWVLIRKKSSAEPGVPYDDAVEEAIAHGWVDSTTHRHDDDFMRVLFARRKRGSTWARSNKQRVARLTAEGRMTPAGLATVEAAKADGSWTLLDDVESLTVPPDLAEALAADPKAQANWDAFPDSAKKISLYHVLSAKRPETRARRIAETVAAAREGVRRESP